MRKPIERYGLGAPIVALSPKPVHSHMAPAPA